MAISGGDGSIILNTKVDTKGLNSGLTSMKGAITKIGGLLAAAFSVKMLINFAKESKNLYKIQMQNEVKLATVMRQRMKATDDEIKSMLELASAQQQIGIIGDEVQLAGLQQVATFATQKETIETLLPAMNNLIAQQYGYEASTESARNVANLMGKVLQGQVGALTRVGITFSAAEEQMLKTGNEMERAAVLAQVITNNVGEMNSALAQTDVGRQQQLANTWGDIKEQFGAAFQQIAIIALPVLNAVAKALAWVANVARMVAQTIANMFGMKTSGGGGNQNTGIGGMATSTEQAAEGMSDLGNATEKAGKKAKKSTASFDDLQILTESVASSAGEAAEEMGNVASGIGGEVGTGFDFGIQADVDTTPIEGAFQRLLEKIEPSRLALQRFIEQLQPLKEFSSQALQDFYNLFLVPVGDWILGEGFPRFVDAISKQLALVDWSRLNGALANLWKSVTPFAINVGEGLLWFWENVITPLISWSLNNLIPAQIDLISAAISFLNELIEIAEPALQWIWDNFFVPLRDYTWQLVIDFIDLLTKTFEGLTSWASNNHEDISIMAQVILNFLAGIWIYNTSKAIVPFLTNLIAKFVEFGDLSGMMTALGTALNSPAVALGALLAAGMLWVNKWDEIKSAFSGMNAWEKTTTIVLGLAAAITVLWVAISAGAAAATIAAGLLAVGLGVGILSVGASNKKAKASKKLTEVPSGRSAISSTVPNKTVGGYSIPGYARGTVVPPNRPHLAWFGDNKQEPEIVSPVSTMKQAFTEAMIEMGGNFGGGNTEVVLEIDGREFGRAVVEQGNRENRRIGTRLVIA